ncbi:MAG: class I SAM-dependent DNA methyltransferase [Ilumatobacteraceae bacterium]
MSNPVTYGAVFADVYDEWYGASDDVNAVIDLLCEESPRSVLELGVGTGRIALALARALADRMAPRHARVEGIDESPEMLAILHAKDTTHRVRTHLGDMVREQPAGPFDLVVCSYNTLFNLTDAQLQAECIANAATRLTPSGRLVIDACVIDPTAPASGREQHRRGPWALTTSTRFNPGTGAIHGVTVSTHDDGRVVERPFHLSYRAPNELDAMCSRVGLHLIARHSSWQKAPFDDSCARHVSVYRNVR